MTAKERDLDHYDKNAIICPFCNASFELHEYDLWETVPCREDHDQDIDCPVCNKTFKVVCTSIDYWFQTYKVEGEK